MGVRLTCNHPTCIGQPTANPTEAKASVVLICIRIFKRNSVHGIESNVHSNYRTFASIWFLKNRFS